MMTKVWKYELPRNVYEAQILMPAAGKILSVQLQGRDIVMWVQVPVIEEGSYPNTRRFRLKETGESIEVDDSLLRYIGTVQIEDYVLHVFEIIS